MVAARAAISPTMSVGQQKLMQYLPVFFAVFQIFFLAALVVYYIFQTLLRIAQQMYITKVFYGHDEALGRQAQRAGEAAREEAAKSGQPTGLFGQAKRDLAAAKDAPAKASGKGSGKKAPEPSAPKPISSKRVTPPKNRPTPSSGAKGRPTSTRPSSGKSSRPKSGS